MRSVLERERGIRRNEVPRALRRRDRLLQFLAREQHLGEPLDVFVAAFLQQGPGLLLPPELLAGLQALQQHSLARRHAHRTLDQVSKEPFGFAPFLAHHMQPAVEKREFGGIRAQQMQPFDEVLQIVDVNLLRRAGAGQCDPDQVDDRADDSRRALRPILQNVHPFPQGNQIRSDEPHPMGGGLPLTLSYATRRGCRVPRTKSHNELRSCRKRQATASVAFASVRAHAAPRCTLPRALPDSRSPRLP
ncbi:hypothetical protein EMIT0158MI4_190056 [Burkholderia ambifaria]